MLLQLLMPLHKQKQHAHLSQQHCTVCQCSLTDQTSHWCCIHSPPPSLTHHLSSQKEQGWHSLQQSCCQAALLCIHQSSSAGSAVSVKKRAAAWGDPSLVAGESCHPSSSKRSSSLSPDVLEPAKGRTPCVKTTVVVIKESLSR